MVQHPAADRWALGAAGLVALIAAVDLLLAETVALVAMYVLGPLVAAFRAGPGRTGLVGAVALALAVPMGLVNENFLELQHVVQLLVIALGTTIAVLVALVRGRLETQTREATTQLAAEREARGRSELLARVGELLEAPPDAMLEAITQLAVPDLADLCIVDLLRDGVMQGVAVHATDPAVAAEVRRMRVELPIAVRAGSPHPVARVALEGRSMVVTFDEQSRARFSDVPERADRLRAIGYRSVIVAPLKARGRTLGVMSFIRLGDDAVLYSEADREVALEVARRAGLALDSAQLLRDLTRTESRLEAVLTNLAEAVTVQGPDGSLVFANRAAADLLGFRTVDELVRTDPRDVAARFESFDEHGDPLDPARYPGRQALAGVDEPEPLLTRTISKATGEERWVLTKARPLRDPEGGDVFAVNVMEDVTEVRRAEREQRLLSAASKLLSSSLDVELTLEKAAWAAVPELADWCCVDVPDDRGRVVRRALAAPPERVAEMNAVRDAMRNDAEALAGVLAGEPLLVDELTDEHLRRMARDDAGLEVLRAAGVRSFLAVPLAAGDRVLGALTLGLDASGRRFSPGDVALAQELGRRAGIAVENARVHATRTTIALTLQRSLLPPRLPVVPGLSMAARFRAAGSDEAARVGGDFYDLFPAGGSWFVVIGDVTGKGPEAAAITSLARYTMRTAAAYEPSPAGVLSRLNEALCADPDRRRLCTAVCMRVDPVREDGTSVPVTVACAGHPPPLRLRADGPAEPLEAVAGPLLGAFEDLTWAENSALLCDTQALVLYTDGVTDTRGAAAERFGTTRLRRLCSGLGGLEPDVVASRIDEALLQFEEGPQRDDVALLVLQAASGGPATALAGQADAAPAADLS